MEVGSDRKWVVWEASYCCKLKDAVELLTCDPDKNLLQVTTCNWASVRPAYGCVVVDKHTDQQLDQLLSPHSLRSTFSTILRLELFPNVCVTEH